MDGLEEVILRLNRTGLPMEAWIDGSFVTEKLNPEDSDVAFRVSGEAFDAAARPQKAPVVWASQTDLKPDFLCDCYPFPEYEQGHPLWEHGQWRRAYWLNKFGHNRQEQPKGLAVIAMPFVLI